MRRRGAPQVRIGGSPGINAFFSRVRKRPVDLGLNEERAERARRLTGDLSGVVEPCLPNSSNASCNAGPNNLDASKRPLPRGMTSRKNTVLLPTSIRRSDGPVRCPPKYRPPARGRRPVFALRRLSAQGRGAAAGASVAVARLGGRAGSSSAIGDQIIGATDPMPSRAWR
ncbi:hypothetical protein MCA0341 [Methylococcus capsulatus str. Bath]|uniref:Uncharacterized protein n=1 Tax=Methylococcus capsulatus (strain ATCC 33009 / NCIMB 11132 / Bath) TaxID=243233 RepID=Q60BX2_METCA|nr:hypothetical protein MCA0341 [Methylococcus capsulatus str. Bath]